MFNPNPPANNDVVTLTRTGSGSVIVNLTDPSNPVFASLTIDDQSNHGITLASANSFGTTGGMTVGDAGTGQFNQTGGTTSFRHLTVGSQANSAGTVKLSGGALNDDAIIGDVGVGIFNYTNATHNKAGNLILGNQSTGNGTYTITGNSAQTKVTFVSGGSSGNPNGALLVGNAGTGSFTQGTNATDAGNQVNFAGDTMLGQQIGSANTYLLNSGILTVGSQLAVGGQSLGANSFTQNGGTLNLANTAFGTPDFVSVGPGFAPFGGAL